MNITFINVATGRYSISSNKKLKLKAYIPPLGILYLGKILELKGHKVEVIDICAEIINEEKLRDIVNNSNVIGLTVYSVPYELDNAMQLAKKIKEINPKIKLLLGGPHISLLPEEALKKFNADIAVKGPGEPVISYIINSIEEKKPLANLPGVYYKDGESIRYNSNENKNENLDNLPFPARHLVDKYEYGHFIATKLGKGKVTSILTSRGCPHRCRFCGISGHIPNFQQRSISSVNREIDEIVSQGYSTIAFADDNFLANKERVEKIMDHIIQNHSGLRLWIGDARADSADRNIYEKMKKAGVELINFGIESGNQDVLDFYNKKLSISQIVDTVKLSSEMGFITSASFILGAPIETKEHIRNTINFARSIPLDLANFFPLSYIRGSDLWEEAVREGKINPNDGASVVADSSKNLGNFTIEELKNFTRIAYYKFYYNPFLWYRLLCRSLVKMDRRYIKAGLEFLFNR